MVGRSLVERKSSSLQAGAFFSFGGHEREKERWAVDASIRELPLSSFPRLKRGPRPLGETTK